MIAGTLGILSSPTEDTLESYYSDQGDRLPALDVERTQTGFDGGPVQSGQAAARVPTEQRDVSVAHTRDGDPGGLMIERNEGRKTVTSEWVADPTDSGLVAAASLAGDPEDPFPFDLIGRVAGRRVERQTVDLQSLHLDWHKADVLDDVEMVAAEQQDGATIAYGDAADPDVRPSAGLGFQGSWGHGRTRGVIYPSGYVALYSASSPSAFCRFVVDEILAYCEPPEDEDGEQSTLGGA